VSALVVETLFSGAAMTVVVVLTVTLWRRVHHARRLAWSELRLTYDEAPDPAIQALSLLRL
jgi:hypothetical protein